MIDITYGFPPKEKTAVALGYFDGLHLGHIEVIGEAMAFARLHKLDMASAVFTFNCDTTLPKFQRQEDIISFENKCEMLKRMGVDYIFAPDFAEVCTLTAEDFVKEILVKRLNADFACCGGNFRFGKNGVGTPQLLCELAQKFRMSKVHIVDDVCLDGEMISSTRIRRLLRNGEIEQANRLLGYDMWYRLEVVHGNELGRTMAFPTINQIIPKTNIVPCLGVYESRVEIGGKKYVGITNIGNRPTVSNSGETVMETHILDYSGDLYGQNISISLCRFIRPEKRFDSIRELKNQISEDISKIRKCL